MIFGTTRRNHEPRRWAGGMMDKAVLRKWQTFRFLSILCACLLLAAVLSFACCLVVICSAWTDTVKTVIIIPAFFFPQLAIPLYIVCSLCLWMRGCPECGKSMRKLSHFWIHWPVRTCDNCGARVPSGKDMTLAQHQRGR